MVSKCYYKLPSYVNRKMLLTKTKAPIHGALDDQRFSDIGKAVRYARRAYAQAEVVTMTEI